MTEDEPVADLGRPLPEWTPRPGLERDPARIDLLIEQLRLLWKEHPNMRLAQLLVNLLDPEPNRLFYVEDHVVSAKIFEFRECGVWPSGREIPPQWVISGELPPPEVRHQLRPIFDQITRKGRVEDEDVESILDTFRDRCDPKEPEDQP